MDGSLTTRVMSLGVTLDRGTYVVIALKTSSYRVLADAGWLTMARDHEISQPGLCLDYCVLLHIGNTMARRFAYSPAVRA